MRPTLLAATLMCILTSTSIAEGLESLTQPIDGRLMRASSGLFDPESNLDAYAFKPGQRRVVADLEGPGEIRHLWMTIASRDRRYPRTLVLRIYYDDAQHSSVETPVGDFFGAGNGMRANVTSQPVEVSSYGRSLNCYWRMPFKKRCRVELDNQGTESMTVYFHGDWMKLPSLDDNVRYFHARYRQDYSVKPFSGYTVFEGEGEGHYVGTVFSSQNNIGSWFGEADDRFYIDGEEEPSIIGTGTEDYFNDAWNLRVTHHQRVGTTICEPRTDECRITSYRWHIDDPIPFQKSLKFELERRSHLSVPDPKTGEETTFGFKYRPDHWSSVAFWYQKGVAKPLWKFPSARERVQEEVWIEPAWMVNEVSTSTGLQPQQKSNRTCNLKQCFYLPNDKTGSWVEFPISIPSRGRYAASVITNLNEAHGVWRITLRGTQGETLLSPGLDCFDNYLPQTEDWPENIKYGTTREIKLGSHRLQPGEYRMRFECVGANPQSRHPKTREFGRGMSLCLDGINFRKLSFESPNEWFDNYLIEEEKHFAKQVEQAQKQVAVLAEAIEQHHKVHGEYPAKLADIQVDNSEVDLAMRDPWQQQYQYRAPGIVRPWAFDVWSFHGNSRLPASWIGNWNTPLDRGKLSGNSVVVIEGESLVAQDKSNHRVNTSTQQIGTYGDAPLSQQKLIHLRLRKPGDWVEFALPHAVEPGWYDVDVAMVTAWDYGQCDWWLNAKDEPVSMDGHTETVGVKVIQLGPLNTLDGSIKLRIESTGKNEYSGGYAAGIDSLVLRKIEAPQVQNSNEARP